ncbi:hypothetical protein [Arthrobacter sp. MYb213]|uniref:hypothetical protein n=1 Tax=Arthrobacter sp. MYb213 TaxID=1848595 RepID=UPI0015E27AAC|nr:hypothetical protein [Arthrobacter sp. MYb213]
MEPSNKNTDQTVAPIGDDEHLNEQHNADVARKLREAEERIKEVAHDVERGLK